MSKQKLVLQVYIDKYKTNFNTLTDISFNELPFLSAHESVINEKGERVSKSYYDLKGKEVVRIVYSKLIGIHTFKNVEYPNTFIGLLKSIQFIDWAGEVGYEKKKQPYYFNLIPVDQNDITKGFTSLKMRKILKEENDNLIL